VQKAKVKTTRSLPVGDGGKVDVAERVQCRTIGWLRTPQSVTDLNPDLLNYRLGSVDIALNHKQMNPNTVDSVTAPKIDRNSFWGHMDCRVNLRTTMTQCPSQSQGGLGKWLQPMSNAARG